ncbi:hypothetical protein U14_05204 [Candidatus Moduliflexus flocculans]|uniref:Uncharacterized protein n=1 Tax=Candidatus Moduliflexus flocculans TaxID=1499966 RepID=A0A081BR98_9BACT|nr:hypothetical protein U14_05204 [Candidatus Moduliflexus flocculans]
MSYTRAALPLMRSFFSEEYDGLGLRHILVMPIAAASTHYQRRSVRPACNKA